MKTKKVKRPEPDIKPSEAVQDFFRTVQRHEVEDYMEHFSRVSPNSHLSEFRRYLFAYASVHTTWESNVKLYRDLEVLEDVPSKDALEHTVKNSGAGLHRNRIEGIWTFRQSFWSDPRVYRKKSNESWVAFRNRLVKRMYGLGLAKVSFALELVWPMETQAVCLDVHMLRNMGLGPSPLPRHYHEAEKQFVNKCRAKRIPPAIGRLLFWDKLKKKPSARYWSDCIHPVTEEYSHANISTVTAAVVAAPSSDNTGELLPRPGTPKDASVGIPTGSLIHGPSAAAGGLSVGDGYPLIVDGEQRPRVLATAG